MAEATLDIHSATDEELQAATKDRRFDHIYYQIVGEIMRRKAVVRAGESDLSILKSAKPFDPRTDMPFDPRTDISADAKFLWKRIFIWFWVVPACAAVIYVLAVSLK